MDIFKKHKIQINAEFTEQALQYFLHYCWHLTFYSFMGGICIKNKLFKQLKFFLFQSR